MLYEWKIALRFLKDGKAQTLFILLGIAVGVAVQIFLSSLISGLQENLIDTTIGNRAHITITAKANSSINIPDFEYINTPKKEDKLGYLLIQGFIIGTTSASGPIFNIVVKRDNLVLVVFISTMAGLISSFVPARKSSSLNPMEVIRNG